MSVCPEDLRSQGVFSQEQLAPGASGSVFLQEAAWKLLRALLGCRKEHFGAIGPLP